MRRPNLSALFIAAVANHGSQANVAKKCGITQQMVHLLVSGKQRTIKAEHVLRTAHCLGVKPVTLLSACSRSAFRTP